MFIRKILYVNLPYFNLNYFCLRNIWLRNNRRQNSNSVTKNQNPKLSSLQASSNIYIKRFVYFLKNLPHWTWGILRITGSFSTLISFSRDLVEILIHVIRVLEEYWQLFSFLWYVIWKHFGKQELIHRIDAYICICKEVGVQAFNTIYSVIVCGFWKLVSTGNNISKYCIKELRWKCDNCNFVYITFPIVLVVFLKCRVMLELIYGVLDLEFYAAITDV